MFVPMCRLVVAAAKKVPPSWWWKALQGAAAAVILIIATKPIEKLLDRIMKDRKKNPEKIAELRKLKDDGKITEQQFEELKKTVLDAYAKA